MKVLHNAAQTEPCRQVSTLHRYVVLNVNGLFFGLVSGVFMFALGLVVGGSFAQSERSRLESRADQLGSQLLDTRMQLDAMRRATVRQDDLPRIPPQNLPTIERGPAQPKEE